MSKIYTTLEPALRAWIGEQRVFFVATAPLAATGLANLSPKGGDCLRLLGDAELAYLDLPGSSVETIAHLRENGRIVLMFCAFDGPPKILRLHGTGRAVLPGHADFASLAANFPANPAAIRSIIHIRLSRIAGACGFGVPVYAYEKERDTLDKWIASQDKQSLADYMRTNNASSIDNLPGLGDAGTEQVKLNYLEFPCIDIEQTKTFFTKVFGWKFTDYGPDYTAFFRPQAGLDGGFFRSDQYANTKHGSALAVFYSADLEQTQASIKAAGGAIVQAIFTFPGGRRFHFTEPGGNEFAVWSDR